MAQTIPDLELREGGFQKAMKGTIAMDHLPFHLPYDLELRKFYSYMPEQLQEALKAYNEQVIKDLAEFYEQKAEKNLFSLTLFRVGAINRCRKPLTDYYCRCVWGVCGGVLCVYTHTHTHILIHTYIHILTYTYTHTHTHLHIHTHTYTHTPLY